MQLMSETYHDPALPYDCLAKGGMVRVMYVHTQKRFAFIGYGDIGIWCRQRR